tara:strand:+ start:1676 stop:1987 length:312 start_codon:yes stop_codon:yes gene_type:complete
MLVHMQNKLPPRDLKNVDTLDLQEIYQVYGFNPNTIRREIWEQKKRNPKFKDDKAIRGIGYHLPSSKVGRKITFRKADIDAWLEKQYTKAPAEIQENPFKKNN